MTATIATADLLRHAGWVHSLARALARDEHRAADLAQQTWVTVLERPPVHDTNLRGFLATVLRNLWRQDRRAEARRRRRELAEGPQLPVSPTADVVARAAAQRTVVDAVLALDEPYRGTVLLRFFDGWSVRRIADHQHVPVATVRTRLHRAMCRLRGRLGQRGERGLPAFLLPFLSRSWFLPLLAMKTKLVLGIVTAALGILLATQLPRGSVDAKQQGTVAPPAAASGRTGAGTGTAVAGEGMQRSLVPPVATPAVPQPSKTAVVTGRLHSIEDLPLPGRRIAFVNRTARTPQTSGPDGAFTFPVEQDGRIEIDQSGWTTVLTAVVALESPPRHALVVAAPAIRLAGVVVDELGAPVPQATVAVVLPEGFRARFRDNADASAVADWRAQSSADGRFEIGIAPAVAGAALLTSQPSFLPDRRELPQGGDAALRVILRKPAAAEGALLGEAVDAGDRIVRGAWVCSAGRSMRADDQGNFAVPGGGGEDLLAVSPGLGPVRLMRPADGWPAFLLVRLGSGALKISGRVLGAAGEGQGGVRVWITNGTQFGRGRETTLVEGLACGGAVRGQEPGPDQQMAIWPWTRTAADGSFTLDGLFDRAYDLRAMRDENLLWIDQPAIAAGASGIELRLPSDGTFAEISGRVVSSSGASVANVRIAPMCDAQKVGGSTMHAQATAVRTGDDGRFRLLDVPKRTAYLRLDGEGILPLEFGRGVPGGLNELTNGNVSDVAITVRQRLHVQVELTDPASADSVVVLDGAGKRLMIDVFEGRSRNTTETLAFAAGRTPVFVVPDTATTLVLRLGEREVRRESVVLVGGDVNRLRY